VCSLRKDCCARTGVLPFPAHFRAEASCPARDLAREDRLAGALRGGALIEPWARCGRAVAAIDSSVLSSEPGEECGTREGQRGGGGATHTFLHRPRSRMDEVRLARVGHYGWKLHLACTVAGVWIPLAARLTQANASDSRVAPLLIQGVAR
jgi:hypothetical protein